MKILLDNCTPDPLARYLTGHDTTPARKLGWAEIGNGELIEVAEKAGFELMITCDQNIRYQQNLNIRRIAIVELTTNDWPSIRASIASIIAEVQGAMIGSYAVVEVPLLPIQRKSSDRP